MMQLVNQNTKIIFEKKIGDIAGNGYSHVRLVMKLLFYRPVSNIDFFSKFLERVVEKQLSEYLESNVLLNDKQSAYRRGFSTETALLTTSMNVLNQIDKNNHVLLASLDLQAAFDTIDHAVLLRVCQQRFGINGVVLKWIESYLSGRTQQVCIGSCLSKCEVLSHGVPQGSILGPLFFNMYLTPFCDYLSTLKLDFQLYADDTLLAFGCKKDDKLIIESNLSDICDWFSRNSLKVHPGKSELILIGRKSSNPFWKSMNVKDKSIEIGPTLKSVGVTFDNTMNFTRHIQITASICFLNLRKINSMKRFLTMENRIMVVHMFITNRLDYCNSLLTAASNKDLQILQKIQNYCCRLVYGLHITCSVTLHLHDLHWLPIHSRIHFKVLCFTHRSLYQDRSLPISLQVFQFAAATRSTTSFLIRSKKKKTAKGLCAFDSVGQRLWNDLPHDLRTTSEYLVFKRLLKAELFRRHFYGTR